MHLFDADRPLLRRQRDRRRRAAAGRRARARRQDARRDAGHRLLLRRRRGGRGRVPRVPEPGRAVAAAGAVLLREQPLRDGHRAGPGAGADRPGGCGPRPTAWPPGPVDGMDVLAVEQAARRAADARPRRRRAALPGAAHLPVPRPLDVRPGPLPRQGRDRAVEASATRSTLLAARDAGRRASWPTTTLAALEAEVAAEIDARGRGRARRPAGAGRGPDPVRLQPGARP